MEGSNLLWGVDLGGTKTELVVIDPTAVSADSAPLPLFRKRLATERDNGYEHILGRIKLLIDDAADTLGVKPSKIGFGTPGALDPRNGSLRNSNTLCLNGKPLKSDLQALLETQIEIQNDANCFALAEHRWGAGKGYDSIFGVILGTGVGGGLVVHGQPIIGLQGLGGEWGHNVVCPDGEQCYCGKRGCVETVFSGPALEKFYRSEITKGSQFQDNSRQVTLHEIVDLASKGDPTAMLTIERLCHWFAKALGVVINIVDPHCVVLGGGVSNINNLYGEEVRLELLRVVFNEYVDTPILKNKLGDSAGVFGAAALCSRSGCSVFS
jgi:fructokinase